MLLLNHSAAGAIIALTIPDPALAVPAAFASHFVLDTLPQYSARENFGLLTPLYFVPITIDIALTITFAVGLRHHFPAQANIITACIVAATLPDYFWPFSRSKYGKHFLGWFYRFHLGIQKFESTKGIAFEAIWFAASIFALSRL